MIRDWLIAFAQWLLRVCRVPPPVPIVHVVVAPPPEVEVYLPEARMQTQAVDAAPQSGEWKRHQVYASLTKSFPAAPARDLAMAIEWALRLPEEF
jgi:hypothetical protein